MQLQQFGGGDRGRTRPPVHDDWWWGLTAVGRVPSGASAAPAKHFAVWMGVDRGLTRPLEWKMPMPRRMQLQRFGGG